MKGDAFLKTSSNLPFMAWPAVVTGKAAELQTLLYQLNSSEYLPYEEIVAAQERQLAELVSYAQQHSPHFKQRLTETGLSASQVSTIAGLKQLNLLTRRMLQANFEDIKCRRLAESHLPAMEVKTSGSSGEPVRVLRTAINQRFWQAYTMREHIWQKRDFGGKLAVLRANLSFNEAAELPNWGEPANLLFATGKAYAMPINRNISEQAQWLEKINPDYLLVYPNNLAALLDQKIKLPGLKQIKTMGETLSVTLRQRAEAELKAKVYDNYSSQELGNIAIQCNESGLYHIMAESLIIEILNSKDEVCQPGEAGRVVATDLHNFATPLIRYDIGDYAEPGPSCICGRGLPTLKRIAGRERNMMVVNGERRWPLVGFHHYREIAPILQYQLIQKTADMIEVRLVAESGLSKQQEAELTKIIHSALGFKPELNFTYFATEIPRGKNGKFEEFICELGQERL